MGIAETELGSSPWQHSVRRPDIRTLSDAHRNVLSATTALVKAQIFRGDLGLAATPWPERSAPKRVESTINDTWQSTKARLGRTPDRGVSGVTDAPSQLDYCYVSS